MIHRALRVRDWTVDFLFVNRRNDPDGVLAVLQSYGAPAVLLEQAEDLMDAGPNCGFTFSNSDRRLCLSWIGPQTEGKEWVNTTVHEIVHVAIAVSADAGIDPYTETFAYLVGDITEQISDLLCLLSCDYCREEKID